MSHMADDGRILTPPKEMKPLLKDTYPAFYKLLGHIRFFYVVDEIWDGKNSLVFTSSDGELAAINLSDGAFNATVGENSFDFDSQTASESILENVFMTLRQTATANQRRPQDQLDVDLDEYPNGIRCDLCLVYKGNNENNDFAGNRKFHVMDRNCYYGVEEGWGETEFSTHTCEGKKYCYEKTIACLAEKGFENCFECGAFRTCDYCGVGHNPGECNLGITAEEVTCLIIPYCEVERLELMAVL